MGFLVAFFGVALLCLSLAFIVSIIVGPVSFQGPFIGPPLTLVVAGFASSGVFCVAVGTILVVKSKKGLEIRRFIPKGSKQRPMSPVFEVHRGHSISVTCSVCGAPLKFGDALESSKGMPYGVFTCEFCGAEGYIEWPTDD